MERERVVVVVVMMMMMVNGWVGWLVGWFLGMNEWKSEKGGGNLLFSSFFSSFFFFLFFLVEAKGKRMGLMWHRFNVPYRYPSQSRLAGFSLFLPPKQSINPLVH